MLHFSHGGECNELSHYAIKKNIRELWNILIVNQADGGELFNYTSGAFYRFTMPFMFLGGVHHIYTIIKNWKDKKKIIRKSLH